MEKSLSQWVPPEVLVGIIFALAWMLLHTWRGMIVKLIERLNRIDSQLHDINAKFSNVVSVEEHTKSVTKIWEEINRMRERLVCMEARGDIHFNSAQQ